MIHLSILVATYKRPQMLRQLLRGIGKLKFTGTTPDLEVLVVDNDPKGGSRKLCENLEPGYPWPIVYEVESTRGIPAVRNRAVKLARPESKFLVFIDDDEIPEPQWLDELLRVQQQFDADVVAGPVESKLPPDSPNWATQGQIFRHYRYRTGETIPFSATNNVLVRSEIFQRMPIWFDERFNLSGGSDRHFFMRIAKQNARMVWADEAMVWEEVPASRVTLRWVLRRSYYQGAANAFCEVDVQSDRGVLVRVAGQAMFWISAGFALLPWGLVCGSHQTVLYLRSIAQGLGMLSGLRNHKHEEYRVIHGR